MNFLVCRREEEKDSRKRLTISMFFFLFTRYRFSDKITLGTVKRDTYCMDAIENLIVIGAQQSQKVWVLNIKEGPPVPKGALDTLWETLKGHNAPRLEGQVGRAINYPRVIVSFVE